MLGTDAIIDERRAIADLRTACAEFRSKLQDAQCMMATSGNRDIVKEMLDELSDTVPDFDAMVERLDEEKNEL